MQTCIYPVAELHPVQVETRRLTTIATMLRTDPPGDLVMMPIMRRSASASRACALGFGFAGRLACQARFRVRVSPSPFFGIEIANPGGLATEGLNS